MSAEYLSKKYIQDHAIENVLVASAWTTARPQQPFPQTIERLKFYWCDSSEHKQTKISPELLAEQDVIICMSQHHRQTIRELWFDAVLFNEIAYGKPEDVLDDTEYQNQYSSPFNLDEYVKTIVDYIHEAIPFVIENVLKK